MNKFPCTLHISYFEAQTILDVLDDIDYDTQEIQRRLKLRIQERKELSQQGKEELLARLEGILSANAYLKTIAPLG